MEKIYKHSYTNTSNELSETHVDLSKVVSVQKYPIGVFFHVYLQGRKTPLELIYREESYAAFVAAWQAYAREAS